MAKRPAPGWTTPDDLRAQLARRWDNGDILRARLAGEALFPLSLQLRKPGASDLAEHFDRVADWVDALRAGSQARGGTAYRIHWQTRRNRVQGSNAVPAVVEVQCEADALRWLGRGAEAARFAELADAVLARFPQLAPWFAKQPLRALELADQWPGLMAVLAWFQAHPRPGLYLRELDIPGIHTKFIEAQRGLLAELLDAVLPASAIDAEARGVRGFNRRYGLHEKPACVRLRLLDPALAVHGLTDLAAPVEQLAGFDPGARRVFVTENEVNGLAFPRIADALVIFGLGYGVEVLAQLPWLQQCEIRYWGDIDTHGLAILNRFRQHFPDVRSLLMDRATLLAHRHAWGREDEGKRFLGTLGHLHADEQALLQTLQGDELAPRLRLEQEHVRHGWLRDALTHLD